MIERGRRGSSLLMGLGHGVGWKGNRWGGGPGDEGSGGSKRQNSVFYLLPFMPSGFCNIQS